MRNRTRSRQLFVAWALPLALWAALPTVRGCPVGWQQACAAGLLRCSATQAPAACTRSAEGCPLAHADSLPEANDACGSAAGCPLSHASSESPPSPREPFQSGRAYCLGDPNGGTGLLAQAPQLHSSASLPAIVPATKIDPRAVVLMAHAPERTCRPPPRPWLRRPPARAPPASRLT